MHQETKNPTTSDRHESPSFERGRMDARRGYPPREGSTQYLEGYAEEYALVAKKSRNGNGYTRTA